MGLLETDQCKKQEARGEVRSVCFRGSLTASPDGTGVLQPALTFFCLGFFFPFIQRL